MPALDTTGVPGTPLELETLKNKPSNTPGVSKSSSKELIILMNAIESKRLSVKKEENTSLRKTEPIRNTSLSSNIIR